METEATLLRFSKSLYRFMFTVEAFEKIKICPRFKSEWQSIFMSSSKIKTLLWEKREDLGANWFSLPCITPQIRRRKRWCAALSLPVSLCLSIHRSLLFQIIILLVSMIFFPQSSLKNRSCFLYLVCTWKRKAEACTKEVFAAVSHK